MLKRVFFIAKDKKPRSLAQKAASKRNFIVARLAGAKTTIMELSNRHECGTPADKRAFLDLVESIKKAIQKEEQP